MTFLQIVQKLREKCGVPGTGPTTVISQTGDYLRLCNWAIESWDEIQSKQPNWKWMRGSFSFNTTASKGFYLPSAVAGETGLTDVAQWWGDTFRLYRTSTGRSDEQFLPEWSYDQWRDTFDFGSQTNYRPSIWAEREEDKAILLGPVPDAVYTVTGRYQKTPTSLAANADTPAMPARFHMLVVYRAMQMYAAYEAASEVRFEADAGYDKLMAMLESDQLPELSLGEPLA
jgi:hypothetical protein